MRLDHYHSPCQQQNFIVTKQIYHNGQQYFYTLSYSQINSFNLILLDFKLMMHSRKDMAQKDRKAVFAREIVTKNPVFARQHCQDFFEMFNLYCDNRRQIDLSDILSTARTLGFDKKFKLIYQAVESINSDLAGQWVDFETMLKLITEKIGNPFNESGRRAMFSLVDEENKDILTFVDLKKISEQLKFNLTDEELQEVINNVAGFGKKEITWDQFNKYIAKKVDKK